MCGFKWIKERDKRLVRSLIPAMFAAFHLLSLNEVFRPHSPLLSAPQTDQTCCVEARVAQQRRIADLFICIHITRSLISLPPPVE